MEQHDAERDQYVGEYEYLVAVMRITTDYAHPRLVAERDCT